MSKRQLVATVAVFVLAGFVFSAATFHTCATIFFLVALVGAIWLAMKIWRDYQLMRPQQQPTLQPPPTTASALQPKRHEDSDSLFVPDSLDQ